MIDRLEFVVGEAFQGMRRHALMSLAAVTTVAIALFLFGGLSFAYLFVSSTANDLSGKYEIQAFFKDGTEKEAISATATELRKVAGVKSVLWIPKDKAWEIEKKNNPELTIGLENPLPDSLKITVTDIKKTNDVVAAVKGAQNIEPENVMYHDPTQRFLTDALKLIQWLGIIIGGLMMATAGVLIYNAIRLTIDARKREIRIMQLVGASHLTVRVPFLIEGMVQGLIGGAIATLLLWATYKGIDWWVVTNVTAFKTASAFPTQTTLLVLGTIGALYGLICSTLAIRGPSRLRSRGI